MLLTIVIPTYNRRDYLKVLISQLQNQNKEDFTVEIVVVVDGSTDGTFEMLEDEFPEVHIVKGAGDWWYTKSMNEGFKKAVDLNADFVLTLNDDIEVEPDYILKLIDAYNRVEPCSIVGSISFTKDLPHKVISSGARFRCKKLGISRPYIPMFQEVVIDIIEDKVLPSTILPGRGMLIPVQTLIDITYFDEKFKQYHSDGDFCLRAHKHDFKVYVSWGAHVFVHAEKTGRGTSFIKEPVIKYVQNFFDDTSRLYIPAVSLYKWRHESKILWLFNMLMFFLVSLRNNFFKRKLYAEV